MTGVQTCALPICDPRISCYATAGFAIFLCSSFLLFLSLQSKSCCQSETRVLSLSGEFLMVSRERVVLCRTELAVLPVDLPRSYPITARRLVGSNSRYFAYLHIGSLYCIPMCLPSLTTTQRLQGKVLLQNGSSTGVERGSGRSCSANRTCLPS